MKVKLFVINIFLPKVALQNKKKYLIEDGKDQ